MLNKKIVLYIQSFGAFKGMEILEVSTLPTLPHDGGAVCSIAINRRKGSLLLLKHVNIICASVFIF